MRCVALLGLALSACVRLVDPCPERSRLQGHECVVIDSAAAASDAATAERELPRPPEGQEPPSDLDEDGAEETSSTDADGTTTSEAATAEEEEAGLPSTEDAGVVESESDARVADANALADAADMLQDASQDAGLGDAQADAAGSAYASALVALQGADALAFAQLESQGAWLPPRWSTFSGAANPLGAGDMAAREGVGLARGASGALWLSAIASDGLVRYASRDRDGPWSESSGVLPESGPGLGRATRSALSYMNPVLRYPPIVHLVVISDERRAWHTIRFAESGSWLPIVEIGPGRAFQFSELSLANRYLDLEFCAVTSDGGLVHATRWSDATWTDLEDLEVVAGEVGSIVDVSCTVIAGQLHVVAATAAGGVHHSMHGVDWNPFEPVELAADGVEQVARIASAALDGELQILVQTRAGAVWHKMRGGDGDYSAARMVADVGVVDVEVD